MQNLGHGANVAEMAERYGKRTTEIIDFSSNINPFISPLLSERLSGALEACKQYPDIHSKALRESIATYLGCESKQVIPGNGATEIIYLLMRSLVELQDKENTFRLGIVNPTFSEYERSARLSGMMTVPFQLERAKGFTLNLEAIIEQLDEIDALFICNPNNPTGNVQALNLLAKTLNERGKWLIIDETFMEFVEEEDKYSLIPMIHDFPKLIVIKAITKFFGLPGLRLGYGVSSDYDLLQMMYTFKEPWTINSFAEHLTPELLKDSIYQLESKQYFKVERKRMLEQLQKLEHLKVYPSDTNFFLLQSQRITSDVLKEELIKEHQILIRDASNFVGLNQQFIRVAIKTKKENDLLIHALKQAL